TKKSANRRQMDRGPRLKFSLMSATVEGGEGAARSAAWIVVSSYLVGILPCCPNTFASLGTRSPESTICLRAFPHERTSDFIVLSYAAHHRTSPTISSDFYKTCPASKQRIDVPRARATSRRIFVRRARSFPSSATLALHSATLFEALAPLATPPFSFPPTSTSRCRHHVSGSTFPPFELGLGGALLLRRPGACCLAEFLSFPELRLRRAPFSFEKGKAQ
ncbi:hypothetical protein FB107DRAFT_252890, partial [Schizophyllum commune]